MPGEEGRCQQTAQNVSHSAHVKHNLRLNWNLGIPEDELCEVRKRFRQNILCERLLKHLAVQHFYLFPTREKEKQKLCEMLDIPIWNVRGLDVRARHEKLISAHT